MEVQCSLCAGSGINRTEEIRAGFTDEQGNYKEIVTPASQSTCYSCGGAGTKNI